MDDVAPLLVLTACFLAGFAGGIVFAVWVVVRWLTQR